MSSNNDLKCWEIMKCDNLDCPARSELETPCWEIAKRMGDFRNVSNICRDCVVYMLKKETSALSKKALRGILENRGLSDKIGADSSGCTLQSITNS